MTREEELKYLKGFLKCELCDEMSCKTCDNRKIGSSPKCYDAFKMAIKAVEQEQKWIPISERLPEKYTYTLWCASSGYVRSDYFNGEFWEDAKKYCYEIIAWMPLPEPFKPQETETWNGIHTQITAPKGTFERLFNEAEDDNDI